MSEHDCTYSRMSIKGFPGYYIDTEGNVWSRRCKRGIPGQRGTESYIGGKFRKIAASKAPNGYVRVTFYIDCKRTYHSVHRLVLEAFVGPCPEGMEACHYPDNDRTNNRLENLRWDTHEKNAEDGCKLGTFANALDKDKVLEMRRLHTKQGWGPTKLAKKFGVSTMTAWCVVSRRTWKHVI